MDPSPPKRKRGQSRSSTASSSIATPSNSPSKINTSFSKDKILGPTSLESPRTETAYHFTGLKLTSPVKKLDLDIHADTPLSPSDEIRKRVKVVLKPGSSSSFEEEIPESPAQAPAFKINFGPERTLDPFIQESADGLTLRNEIDPVIRSAQNSLKTNSIKQNPLPPKITKTHSSLDRITADSKPSSKKRAGTPPLKLNSKTSMEEVGSATTSLETDQAALTWHDDEITGHLADDPDDDGRGVNGIGFRPTAAQAYQRLERRRQQMADYKTREAREARAKRGARRRGGSVSDVVGAASKQKVDTSRRVRFQAGDVVEVRVV